VRGEGRRKEEREGGAERKTRGQREKSLFFFFVNKTKKFERAAPLKEKDRELCFNAPRN
jgi:hypothetical protein